MRLMTKELAAVIPPLYAQEEAGDDAVVYAKFFDPFSGWTWYVLEYNPVDEMAFGYVVGFEAEYGYFSIDELASVGRIERDLHFQPQKIGDIKAKHADRW